jgi:hypothetical protein
MMKDQFANYVVQKVLETCDDQQREMILTRIKTHLNTLKKYTYGKHIVARVEKLVAAGGICICSIFIYLWLQDTALCLYRVCLGTNNDVYFVLTEKRLGLQPACTAA